MKSDGWVVYIRIMKTKKQPRKVREMVTFNMILSRKGGRMKDRRTERGGSKKRDHLEGW